MKKKLCAILCITKNKIDTFQTFLINELINIIYLNFPYRNHLVLRKRKRPYKRT
jgi:hypothetical protein